ncbi:MAG: T9SS type A sorting domain-containing protein [Bacteroidales bacterium]|nr:T9SS type A sorting domain-containing protein [Bacteroidales bacterium]
MKKICLFGAFILFFFTSFAQEIQFTLLQSSNQEAVIRVDFPNYYTHSVMVDGQRMALLSMPEAYPINVVGNPQLLQTATSLMIPENSVPTAEILHSSYQTVTDFELAPSKGTLYRNINPQDIPYQKGPAYWQDKMFYNDTVTLGDSYQLHDYHGIPVRFYPFAYNPVRKELKVYSSITVRIRFNSTTDIQHPSRISKTFKDIYQNHFLNYHTMRSTPLEENGAILILAPEEFCAAMQPYADWKIKNGYPTEIVSLSTIGNTSSAVKNYITNYYNSHNLTFVLLVGDSGKFPTITANGNISDNYYGEIAGNDNYADVIIGKISAETVDHVNTQVDRFLQYEQNPPETSHLPVFCGIASDQGPGDNNEYDYTHIRNIDNILQNYTYTSGYEFFEGSQGGLDASGNPTATQVANAINSGVGIINYCGHGDYDMWVSSSFSNSNVQNLTNYNKLPFIISVACQNGNYSGKNCFAEAWMRATKNGQPTGAVSTLMSTINQSWNEPMCGQDRMIQLLTGANNTPQRHTFGGIVFNGFLHMLDTYSNSSNSEAVKTARTWVIFGDPSLLVRTAVPQPLNLNYTNSVVESTPNITFSSPVENAKVTLSYHNQVFGTGSISNGTLLMNLPTNTIPGDTICVVATHPNYIPFVGTLTFIPNNGPYVLSELFTLNDNGNHDGNADNGETVNIDMNFHNIGNQNASNIQTVLSTNNPHITIMKGTLNLSQLGVGANTVSQGAYKFKVADNAPAFETANFTLMLTYNGEAKQQEFSIPLHAPQLAINNLTVLDTAGNRNGRLDFGEKATLLVNVGNVGNGSSANGSVYVSNPDGKLKFLRGAQFVPALQTTQSHEVPFYIQVKSDVTEPTITILHIAYYSGDYTIIQDIPLRIGASIEDWESGDFTTYEWQNDNSHPWVITTKYPYEGTYAAKSGTINNNQSSTLSIRIEVGQPDTLSFYYKVSSEEGYDFLNFYINGTKKDAWSGEIDWTKAQYIIPAGQHTLKWEYKKDQMMSSGNDMAMLDLINLPIAAKSGVGIEEVVSTNEILVYPNPTRDMVKIHSPEARPMQYQLLDLSGRVLLQGEFTGDKTLSLASCANGIYLMRLTDRQHIVKTFKIVKQ